MSRKPNQPDIAEEQNNVPQSENQVRQPQAPGAAETPPGKQGAEAQQQTAEADVGMTQGGRQGTKTEQKSLSPEEYEKQIAALRQEVEDFRNRAMRWQAELENYQKRISRQLAEERKYAAIDLMRDLLPVYDNLQRAIQAAEKDHDVSHLLEGLRMIIKQWEDVFKQHHCTRIEAFHQPFDPHFHYAISRQATADAPPNTVLYVAQDGFVLHDRVVRPSQVVVSMALPAAGSDGAAESARDQQSGQSSDNHPPQPQA